MDHPNPRIGIGVFVFKDGKFAMGQRRNSHRHETWSVPGGHLEFGESFEDTARREVMEETGLTIKNIRFGAVTNDIFEAENKHYVTVWMLSDYDSGELTVMEPDKFALMDWFDFDSLPSPLFLPWNQLLASPFITETKNLLRQPAERTVTEVKVNGSGKLNFMGQDFHCALGKNGLTSDKTEGDGKTPIGRFPLKEVLYRADRVDKPHAKLPVRQIQPEDGWCDDPSDSKYNRPVILPYHAHAESLWRQDNIYDVVVVLGHNDSPVMPGAGSAIFMHVARADYSPTDGCVALALPDLLAILAQAQPGTIVSIG